MNRVTILIAVAILLASAIAGTVVYYNSLLSDKSSQITSLNQQIAKDNNQIANLTAQVKDLKASTVSYEKLTLSNVSWFYQGAGGIYDWNITFDVTNNGNATAIINNVILDGQSYNSLNPVPTISPAIEKGYTLLPNQTVLIIIKETNSTFFPFRNGGLLDVTTAIGNSYSFTFESS
ncbi:MAG TPA: hypothetical protein VK536_01835 [Candidatus Limnocylindrales bacterium]|nr:hypothetical protein [Candidatus Limnocylindrales bacterium]